MGYAYRVCSFFDVVAAAQAALEVRRAPKHSLLFVTEGKQASSPLTLHIPLVHVCVPHAIAPADTDSVIDSQFAREIASLGPVDVSLKHPLRITGSSGIGKTSALRILAGLWPQSPSGAVNSLQHEPVSVPDMSSLRPRVMFVPNTPRLLGGATLRQNLAYPSLSLNAAAGDFADALHACELTGFIQALDEARADWASTLSGGEAQRIMAARVWLHRPAFVFLDEGLSAVDAETRFRVLRALVTRGVAYVIVSHDAPVI